MVDTQYEKMSILELKGILYDMQVQINSIQSNAQNNILPILNKKIKEEADKLENISVTSLNQKDGVTAKVVKAKEA